MTTKRFFLRLISALTLSVAVVGGQTKKLPDFDRVTPTVLAVRNVGPAVVNIRTQTRMTHRHLFSGLFASPGQQDGERLVDSSQGSGVIVHPSGLVITNEHVIHSADRVLVGMMGREQPIPARILNRNTDSDLAVLKLDPAHAPYATAQLGDSDTLMVGERTIALGNPFGLNSSVTAGLLSATGRSVTFQGRDVFKDFLQTSAIINPGNSGGPLLDVNGRVIGINVAIDRRGPGIGYAIPVNRVCEVVGDLLNPEFTVDAWLGFDVVDGRATTRRSHGVVVERVYEDGPAKEAGIVVGDRLIRVNDTPLHGVIDFHAELISKRPGTIITLETLRRERKRVVRVRLTPIEVPRVFRGDLLRAHGMTSVELTPERAFRLGMRSPVAAVLVAEVKKGTPAAKVGLRARDLIFQLGRFRVSSVEELGRVLSFYARRGSAELRIYRRGEIHRGTIRF